MQSTRIDQVLRRQKHKAMTDVIVGALCHLGLLISTGQLLML